MIEFCRCLNAGHGHQIMVTYLTHDMSESTALVDHRDGHGVDKHSNRRIKLRWDTSQWVEEKGL